MRYISTLLGPNAEDATAHVSFRSIPSSFRRPLSPTNTPPCTQLICNIRASPQPWVTQCSKKGHVMQLTSISMTQSPVTTATSQPYVYTSHAGVAQHLRDSPRYLRTRNLNRPGSTISHYHILAYPACLSPPQSSGPPEKVLARQSRTRYKTLVPHSLPLSDTWNLHVGDSEIVSHHGQSILRPSLLPPLSFTP